jgi:ubiquinone biosynthesis monooxygenase Coq7
VRALASQPDLQALRRTLMECQADEVAHRDEAAAARGFERPGRLLRAWCALVGAGSHAAVSVIRHV